MTNRSQKSGRRTAIGHFSLVIGHFLSQGSQRLYGEIRYWLRLAALSSSVVAFICLTVVLDLEDFAPSQCRLVGDDAGQRVSDGLIHVDGRVPVLDDRANELVGEESV